MRNPLNKFDNSEDIKPKKSWKALEMMNQELEYEAYVKDQHSLEQGHFSFIGKGRIVAMVIALALALTFCLSLVSPVALMLFVILLFGVVLSPLANDQ